MKKHHTIQTATALAVACTVLFGCSTTQPTTAMLLNTLKARDTQALDLVIVGQNLVKQYGNVRAEKLVLDAWAELTSGADPEKSKDVIWLVSQTPRVRDVAWLVQYRSEWLKP